MRKFLPYILIVLLFVFIFFTPLFWVGYKNRNLYPNYLANNFASYVENPIRFLSNLEYEVNYPNEEPQDSTSAFSDDTNEDSTTVTAVPSEFDFPYEDLDAMDEKDFVHNIRDKNLFDLESEPDKDFIKLDILNMDIGDDFIGAYVSFSGNESLIEEILTVKSFCTPENSFLYDSDWDLIESSNVDIFESLSAGDQLVTSCLDKECLFIGRYCAGLKWSTE